MLRLNTCADDKIDEIYDEIAATVRDSKHIPKTQFE